MLWCMRQRTNIYLDPEQCVALDRQAEAEGVSRAEVIRRHLDAALARDAEDLAADLAAIDDSFGVVDEALEIPTRGPGDREQHLEAVGYDA